MAIKHKVGVLLILITLLAGCARKEAPLIALQNIFAPDTLKDDTENIIVYLRVNNSTQNTLYFNNEDYNLNEKTGFFISSKALTRPVKLTFRYGTTGDSIKHGEKGKLMLLLKINALTNALKNDTLKTPSYNNLKAFLKNGDYSLVYNSNIKPFNIDISKTDNFRTLFLNPTDVVKTGEYFRKD